MCRILLCILGALVAGPVAGVEVLLYEDFQDANADGWRAFGNGDIRVTTYEGNASLRLTRDAMVTTRVSTEGMSRVRVGAAIAANNLDDSEACIVEATLDDGDSWFEVLRVAEGQDDSVTLHTNAVSRDVDDARHLWLRARVAGNGNDDTCWLDNTFVVATAAIPDTPVPRVRELDKAFLLGTDPIRAPVKMHEFAGIGDADSTPAVFSGTLTLAADTRSDGFESVDDSWGRVDSVGDTIRRLPEFSFHFFQRGADLLPLERGVRKGAHPYWEIILQPGRVWTESADKGWTRAAIPFALQERGANCVHNGAMTWLFNAPGDVSRVAYQVSSETCGYLKFNLWGVTDAEYVPQELAAEALPQIERLDAHRAARLPVRSLETLADDYPHLDPLGLAIEDGIHPDDLSVYGLVVDGINYRSECTTRHGAHPYCDSLPLPSYSTAKSLFAGVAGMRLESLRPGSVQRSIADLVAGCDSKRWRDVTVEHALDMATGNYRSIVHEEDEHSEPSREFIFSDNHADKLEFACQHYKRKAKPGTQFVYHTSDTYLAGTALQAIVREQLDGDADVYFDVLLNPLWRSLELSPLLDDSLRTYDSARQPFAGYGLTYEADDILRISSWLMDGAELHGQPALDEALLAASLQRDPRDRGVRAIGDNLRYNNGFWGYNSGPSLGCSDDAWSPFMSGVSGITVAMFANGVIYYYFSDSYVFRWQSAREAAHAIKELCQ